MTDTATDSLEYDPYDYETFCDPYPIFARLREEAPVYRNDKLDFWLLSRHADVMASHNDFARFSSTAGPTIEKMPPEQTGPLLIAKDPPEHRWHRKVIGKVFTPRRINALEPYIRERCRELLDPFVGEPEFDVAEQFALQLPLNVISELLNIPHSLRDEIHELADQTLARTDDPGLAEKQMLAQIRIFEIFHGLVVDRESNPRDDIISVIMNTEVDDDDEGTRTRKLEAAEVAIRFQEIAFAGHETVAKGIPNGTMAFTSFPDQRRLLASDPSRSGAAADEVLRYDPPSQLQGRLTTEDVTLHGVTIPQNSRVMLATAAAMRDPRAYPDPDRFDISRESDPSTIYFGFGVHRCIGAHLARLEMRVAFEELLTRFPDFAVDESRAVRHVSSNVRGVAHLPLLTKGAS
ncbi:MAG TPA: cytochrome P450 [Frankiaceae bacterium]|jgi:cytochrome P450|nr:cytochrome P450 [Frankiaceae bacterium]